MKVAKEPLAAFDLGMLNAGAGPLEKS